MTEKEFNAAVKDVAGMYGGLETWYVRRNYKTHVVMQCLAGELLYQDPLALNLPKLRKVLQTVSGLLFDMSDALWDEDGISAAALASYLYSFLQKAKLEAWYEFTSSSPQELAILVAYAVLSLGNTLDHMDLIELDSLIY